MVLARLAPGAAVGWTLLATLLPGLAGCRGAARSRSPAAPVAGAPAAGPGADAEASRARTASTLQDDYERIFPERVRLARYGEVRFSAGDPGDAAGDGTRSEQVDTGDAPSLVVVDKVGERVRVIAPQDHVRLLLWVDGADLYHVVTDAVVVAATSDAARGATGSGGVRLHPGAAVEIDGERGAMARMRIHDDCVSVTGWAPRAALGTLFVPAETEEQAPTGVVAAGASVLDRPGGREVARFVADCAVTDTGPESAGQRPIRYATPWLEVRGWVAAGSGKGATGVASGASAWGYGLSGLGLWGARSRLRLAEGTCLYARRGGSAIGVVTEDADAPESPPVDGWWQIPLETGWGDLDVWVAEDRAPAAPRAEASGSDAPESPTLGPDDTDDVEDEPGAPGGEATRPSLRRCR